MKVTYYFWLVWIVVAASLDVRADAAEDGTTAEPAADQTELAPEILAPIRHKTMGISADEQQAYYAILQKVATLGQRELRAAAARHLAGRRAELEPANLDRKGQVPLFADMFRNPQAYTGQLVSLRGHIRKVMSYPADENDFGVTTLHELWLFPADSQSNPVVVVCTELPADFPKDSEIIDNVSVTGYFFKVYGYQAQDAARGAPLILAHRPSWNPQQIQTGLGLPPFAVAAGVLIVVAGFVWFTWRTHRKDREISNRRLMEGAPVVLEPPEADQT